MKKKELTERDITGLPDVYMEGKNLRMPGWSVATVKLNKGETLKTIHDLAREHAEWSDKTFGDHRSGIGPLKHLKLEIEELLAAPKDLQEWGDVILLTLDALRREGFTINDVIKAGFDKLEVNKKRTWAPPDKDGVSLHIKDQPQDCCGNGCDCHE